MKEQIEQMKSFVDVIHQNVRNRDGKWSDLELAQMLELIKIVINTLDEYDLAFNQLEAEVKSK
jgi:hypothetical protein